MYQFSYIYTTALKTLHIRSMVVSKFKIFCKDEHSPTGETVLEAYGLDKDDVIKNWKLTGFNDVLPLKAIMGVMDYSEMLPINCYLDVRWGITPFPCLG